MTQDFDSEDKPICLREPIDTGETNDRILVRSVSDFDDAEYEDAKAAPLSPVDNESQYLAPIRTFISYAAADTQYRLALEGHLSLLNRQGLIRTWHDGRIQPGEGRDFVRTMRFAESKIIVLLVSANFIESDECYLKELGAAKRRHRRGEVVVLPVLIRPVDYETSVLGRFMPVPRNVVPIETWPQPETAWLEVAQHIRTTAEILQRNQMGRHFVIEVTDGPRRCTFKIGYGEQRIVGRSSRADVILSDSMVSKKHARLSFEFSGLIIEDLNSSNHTFVNERLIERAVIRAGQNIRVGDSILTVIEEPAPFVATLSTAK